MHVKLTTSKLKTSKTVNITGSKSESNRLLILKALYSNITLQNLSNSDDTSLMLKALSSKGEIIDIHHAGTAMRFLTAYFALRTNRKIVLTGSKRMKERPIGILVDALRTLGAKIDYIENEGFPPLQISPSSNFKDQVTLKANVSSQYISALLLVAPSLPRGLELSLEGKITSLPYIKMTLALLNAIGVQTKFEDNTITVKPLVKSLNTKQNLVVESDWSSASYYFSLVALSEKGTSVTLSAYNKDSLQGDSVLVKLYQSFGVETKFFEHSIELRKISESKTDRVDFDLSNAPDIAQTIAVTCFGLGLSCKLSGLHTLKIKETDRLVALKQELEKLGGKVTITEDTLKLYPSKSINNAVRIETYNDHRMAMAFAPLALKTDIVILDSEVVSKSYPDFWTDLNYLGIKQQEINA